MPTEAEIPLHRTASHRSSLRKRLVVLCLLWVVALVPFVFFRRNTWFGRPLSDQQIGEYLHASQKPRLMLHALGQIGQRMSRHDPSVSIWYADLVRLSVDRNENVRATDARVMGEAADIPDIHGALLNQLQDGSQTVRFDAAVSLAGVGDVAGHDEIIAALQQSAPTPDQTLQALTALQQIGGERDLAIVAQYEAPRSDIPERVRQQAIATGNAIRSRIRHTK